MPSSALTTHLQELLKDAEDLEDAHSQLRTGRRGRQFKLAALNRATLVLCVSAWESYVEELMRECLQILRPIIPPIEPWPALNAYVLGLLGRFHTPNAGNVSNLINSALGLPNIPLAWKWAGCTSMQAIARLEDVLEFRHQIAHGVNPRPTIRNYYSRSLPGFIRRLADCTDRAVRDHVAIALGIPEPWPL